MGGTYSQPRVIQTQWFNEFEEKLPSLEGKVVVITGCTTGTGNVAARTCAKKGAHVVMLNRASERATKAKDDILELFPQAKVTAIECDLMDFENVKRAAASLNEQFGEQGIDIICCNAGVMAIEDRATKDGYDVQMQTNHLSHFLLIKEIYPLVEKASELRGDARIVNHSSGARRGAVLVANYLGKNGGNLGGNGNSMFFGGARWVRYHHSKLANVVFTLALADKLKAKGSKVITTCAAPGFASTNLSVSSANDGGMTGNTWLMRYAQSGEDGTMPLLQCMFGDKVESGDFIEPQGNGLSGLPVKVQLSAACLDAPSRVMLWEESEKACGEWKLE